MTTRVIVPMPEPIVHLYGKELVAVVTHNNDWDIEGLELGKFRNSLVDMFHEAAIIRAFDDPLEYHPSLSLKYATRVVKAMDTEFPGIHISDDNEMETLEGAIARGDIDDPRTHPEIPILY